MSHVLKTLSLVSVLLLLTACSGIGPLQLDLMQPPDIFDEEKFNPFDNIEDPEYSLPYNGVLYATDREAADDFSLQRYYQNERSTNLKLGLAEVSIAGEELSWDEAKKISLDKNRKGRYPTEVVKVTEIASLNLVEPMTTEKDFTTSQYFAAAKKYADIINSKLATSRQKDIYIYVHGYKTTFENPVLVSAQLWHYMAYDGVFIAYAWPATPSRWAYLRDTDAATGYARNFRVFLTYLARETQAERIHIIGYSAGTRLVTEALFQIALGYREQSEEEIHEATRIGNLILTASDLDRGVFYTYVIDGLLKVPVQTTVYGSQKDKALSVSRLLTKRERLGEIWKKDEVPETVSQLLEQHESNFSMVDITGAEGWDFGNGHSYFRNSPWVSSDILMELIAGLTPKERGLEQDPKSGIWTFPDDYIQRARKTIEARAEITPSAKFLLDK